MVRQMIRIGRLSGANSFASKALFIGNVSLLNERFRWISLKMMSNVERLVSENAHRLRACLKKALETENGINWEKHPHSAGWYYENSISDKRGSTSWWFAQQNNIESFGGIFSCYTVKWDRKRSLVLTQLGKLLKCTSEYLCEFSFYRKEQ